MAQRHNDPPTQSPPETQAIGSIQIQQSAFSGPIPPPEFLQKYNEILPGLADRLVRMAEKQEDHRHALERSAVKAEITRGYIGQASGLIVALTGLAIGGWLLYRDKPVAGSLFAGGT